VCKALKQGKIKTYDKLLDLILKYVKDPDDAEKVANKLATKFKLKD